MIWELKALHLTFYFSCVYYYMQKYYSCKRGSVAGLNFNFVGMCFTGIVAYLTFNISLFWIPQVQVTFFVDLNQKVIYSNN